jgi:L-alanine-DL-glutamate epimerase-like enolase superfamily enzyme
MSSLRVWTVQVPMRQPFTHAGYHRVSTDSLLVRVEVDGVVGWGEGAPRPYVTGESLDSAAAAVSSVDLTGLLELVQRAGFADGVLALDRLDLPLLVGGALPAPAAAAAVEGALLSVLCRIHGRSFSDVLDALSVPDALRRSAAEPAPITVVMDSARSPEAFLAGLDLGTVPGIKVKAQKDVRATVARVRAVARMVGEGTPISIDVNGGWTPTDLAAATGELLDLGLAWIEEPCPAGHWWALRQAASAGLRIMLDESCSQEREAVLAARTKAATHINVRVSKCGGVLPAIRLVRAARELGLAVQLGVQVGEVGPLWAAGRALATHIRGWVSVEAGRQDEWFERPLSEPPFVVDRLRHRAPPVPGDGLSVEPTEDLMRHAVLTTVRSEG